MEKRTIYNFLSFLLIISFFSFTIAQDKEHSGGHDIVHWSYKGETGPLHWGDLKSEYEGCKTGKSQTPINLTDAYKSQLGKLKYSYSDQSLSILNNGHTVQINFKPGGSLIIDELKFELLQYYFHTPSEHVVNGKHYPMEMHLVHMNTNKELGVMGLFFIEGNKNIELQKILDNAPKKINAEKLVSSVTVNPSAFFPYKMDYYHYFGSLTTPPCTEGVSWIVLKNQVEASKEQIEKMESILGENARPVQSLNKRFLLESN